MIMTRRPAFFRVFVTFGILCAALPLVLPSAAQAVRIKDIATFSVSATTSWWDTVWW